MNITDYLLISNISLMHYLVLSTLLFTIGICGIIMNRRNIIVMLMAIELMLLAANINFVAFSAYLKDLNGQIFTIFILTVAAAEAAIGIAIMLAFFRNKGNVSIECANEMRG